MSRVKPNALAVGVVFPFHQAVNPDSLAEWLSDEGFSAINQPVTEIAPGVQFSSKNPLTVAKKDNIEVLFNPDGNVDGLGSSTFITVQDEAEVDFDRVTSTIGMICSRLEEGDLAEDVSLFEMTYEGQLAVDRDREFSGSFNQQQLDNLEDSTGEASAGVAARFEAKRQNTEPGWYRLLVDSNSIGNPRLWAYRLVRRYDRYDKIEEKDVNNILETLLRQDR